jgi:hypothetical protein
MALSVPYGHVRLTCDDPPADLLLLLGEGAPRLTAGLGGWEITARPRQIAMTTWQGSEPFALELAVMLDGYRENRSVEGQLRRLVAVARGDDESPPGVLRLQGLPVPAERWVLEALEYGDAILRGDGQRLRQPLTLTLREYVPPSYLTLRRNTLQGSSAKTRLVRARRGDTPASIARRQRCVWTDLRELNPALVRKANQRLAEGTKLRCPVARNKDRKPHQPSRKARQR